MGGGALGQKPVGSARRGRGAGRRATLGPRGGKGWRCEQAGLRDLLSGGGARAGVGAETSGMGGGADQS